MDSKSALTGLDPAIGRFAARLRDELGAGRVLLFGPRAHGCASWDTEYGFIIVAERFASIPPLQRTYGIHDLFYGSGGNAPLKLFCVTPEEFENASRRGAYVALFIPEAVDLLPQQGETTV